MWHELHRFLTLCGRVAETRSYHPVTLEDARAAQSKVFSLLEQRAEVMGCGIRIPTFVDPGYAIVVHLRTELPSSVIEEVKREVDVPVIFEVVGDIMLF